MSDNGTSTIASTGWMKKKVGGIPVVYLAAGFVVILAVIAWQMKPSATAADNAEVAVESADDTIMRESEVYPALPLGTVTASSSERTDNSGNTSISTNDEWLRRGVMYLAGKGVSPGDAQLALTTYLDGNEVTFEQGGMRDDVIRELGMPPYPVLIGGTRADVARTQGPLPRSHIVKNTNDDTAGKIAQLYYGRADAFAVSAVSDKNGGRVSYNVGDSVEVPVLPTPAVVAAPSPTVVAAPTPTVTAKPTRYYTVVRGDTLSGIAYRYYRNASKWTVIYNANRGIIKNANLIYPGQRFVIPYI